MANGIEEVVVNFDADSREPSPDIVAPNGHRGSIIVEPSAVLTPTPMNAVSTLDWFRDTFNAVASPEQKISINEWRVALQYPVSVIDMYNAFTINYDQMPTCKCDHYYCFLFFTGFC